MAAGDLGAGFAETLRSTFPVRALEAAASQVAFYPVLYNVAYNQVELRSELRTAGQTPSFPGCNRASRDKAN